MPRRIVAVVRRDPYPMLIAFGTSLAGLIQLAFWEFSPTVTRTLGEGWVVVWSVAMLIGGILVITGFYRGHVQQEILGLSWLGLAQVVYAVCQAAAGGIPLLVAAMVNLTVAFAHFSRAKSLRPRRGPDA